MTQLFGAFTGLDVPGAPFLCGALLCLVSVVLLATTPAARTAQATPTP
jgi:hypothetical protein